MDRPVPARVTDAPTAEQSRLLRKLLRAMNSLLAVPPFDEFDAGWYGRYVAFFEAEASRAEAGMTRREMSCTLASNSASASTTIFERPGP